MEKKTILLIDDDNALADVYKTSLEGAGFKFLRAADGEEGINLAKAEKPDLILLDVLMPKMTGPEVLIKLKAEATTKGIPVLFLTNLEGEQDTARFAAESGATGYLVKSETSLHDLVEKIKHALGIKY